MNNLKQLKSSYSYMFAGQNICLGFHPGWLFVFSKLCDDIDLVLNNEKYGFHWMQIKEKFGIARFYWQLDASVELGQHSTVKLQISRLVEAAVECTSNTCIVCGDAGTLDKSASHLLTLCAQHTAERKAGVRLTIEFNEQAV